MATYYIAPSGSDTSGSGTLIAPWATINKFLTIPPSPGDTLLCRGGTYTGANNRTRYVYGISGSSGSPITVAAYPGEVPIFDGESTGTTQQWRHFIIFTNSAAPSNGGTGARWWVFDGLRFTRYEPTGTGMIVVGNWNDNDTTATGDFIIRNCWFENQKQVGDSRPHMIYGGTNVSNVTVEDCRFLGSSYPGADTGAAVHFYHAPGNSGHLIQRNIISGFEEGIQIAQWPMTCSILHNTFVNCKVNIDAAIHSTMLVRDNAAEAGDAWNIWQGEPDFTYGDYRSYTTQDHNYWTETFNADYSLKPGSPAINGALDGSDAGAIPYDEGGSGVARSIIVVI